MQFDQDGADSRWSLPVLLATTAALSVGADLAQAEPKPQSEPSIWERATLTGDWGGVRTQLKDDKGIELTIAYIGETLGVISGGINRRASYEGRLEFSVDTDLEKLGGWKGGSTHVTAFQIHNTGGFNAVENVGSIADPSNIDALPTTRLFTAWFQQGAADDPVSLRVGRLAADDEFFTSPTAGGLINGTFGWPGWFASDMLNGGPAYPLATNGARLQLRPAENLAVLAAVFNGNPAGPNCTEEAQVCNRYGWNFGFAGGSLWLGELQYAVNPEKKPESKPETGKAPATRQSGLPGVYKLGVWFASADFADQRFGLNGVGAVDSLADPTAVFPLNHRGNWGVYGVLDQMVWRGSESSANVFLRGGGSPDDRNLISWYVDGGLGIKGPFAGRADDVLTFGIAYANISNSASALDHDTAILNGAAFPIRNQEIVFELSYQAQIAPWWIVQPDLQYIVYPGGNVPNPNNPAVTIGNAFIAGLRSTMKF
jgi:porin